MNMHYLFRLVLLLLVLACKKEAASDRPFSVGEYDEYDYHLLYDEPVVMVIEPGNPAMHALDFEGDKSEDFTLSAYYSGSAGGSSGYQIAVYSLSDTGSWELATQIYHDSVYVCTDTVPFVYLQSGVPPTYYSSHLNFSCAHLVDTLYRLDSYQVPQRFKKGESPISAGNWSQAKDERSRIYFLFSNNSNNPSVGRYNLKLNYYQEFKQQHYLVFRQPRGQAYRYAWLRLKVDYEAARMEILETATQGVGKQ